MLNTVDNIIVGICIMNSFQKWLVLLWQPVKLLKALSDLFMPGFVFF